MHENLLSRLVADALAESDASKRAAMLCEAIDKHAPTLWRRVSVFRRSALLQTAQGPWRVDQWSAGQTAEPEGPRYIEESPNPFPVVGAQPEDSI